MARRGHAKRIGETMPGRGRRGSTAGGATGRGGPTGTLAEVLDPSLALILLFVLDVSSLMRLALVCRRWGEAVGWPGCWTDKVVRIANRSLSPDVIRKWYARWRAAKVVMTYSQRDLLVNPFAQAHVIHHPWGAWGGTTPWGDIMLAGVRWIICMTRERSPDVARIEQEHLVDERLQYFETPIYMGWTSARSPSELSRAHARHRRHQGLPEDVILALMLYPMDHWMRVQTQQIVSGQPQFSRGPPCFDELSPRLATLRLCRARREISFDVCEDDFRTLRFRGAPIPEDAELTFFIATLRDAARDAGPRPRLPSTRLRWTRFDP